MSASVPNAVEVSGLLAAAALLAGSAAASMARRGAIGAATAAVCGWGGVAIGAVVLVWHLVSGGAWLPLDDNFDALATLGLMLAGCVMYVQSTRPVGGLDRFVLPVAAFMLITAAIFGRVVPHTYGETAWSWTHRLTAYGGTLALAVAGAVGAMYLVATRRLRDKRFDSARGFANLERLEAIANLSLALGWPLFTIGLVTGILWGIHRTSEGANQQHEFFGPKVLLALGVWVVYALALHTPINPSFRGRKAAVLSLIGLLLMAGTLVAVQFMPGGAGGTH
jgi:ABC-type transport system involved in cytochrome c biogenesis permease subunit